MSHQFLYHSTLLSSPLSPPPDNLLNLSNRTVVEIGSGCGLLPIALSKLPSNAPLRIVATEYLPSIITHLESQVEKNGASVEVRKLDWFSSSDVIDCSSSSDTILMSDCTLDPSESPVILDAIEELLVRSYEAKFRKGFSSSLHLPPPHTDVVIGYCLERGGTARFLDLASSRFLITPIQNFHPSYSPTYRGKERYAVVHMFLKPSILMDRISRLSIDHLSFASFYSKLSSTSSTSFSPPPPPPPPPHPSIFPSLPFSTAMTHVFGTRTKPSYALWLEILPPPPHEPPSALNNMVNNLTPRYWEVFVPHVTLSLDFDAPPDSDFLGLLDKVRTAYFMGTTDAVDVRISSEKNKQGNGGEVVNMLNYKKTEASPEGFDALILYLLLSKTPTLEFLNKVANDVVKGSRDVTEFQPHIALSYWENKEGSGGWKYNDPAERKKLADLLDTSAPLVQRPVISIYSLSGVGVSSWNRLASLDLSMK
ncbi:hypothetical protein TrCOL_g8961 [Triparma columacea]|uniref:Uncharacterized protein n=1 Tax=Triparma columacea TaxID=722753 RepID=A0A9W7L3Q1_9STRA|nr:hypothetical protein TrCOL_g8961 [Triparma columacea]